MPAHIPYTNGRVKLPSSDDPAQETDYSAAAELRIPHILDCMAEVGATARELHALALTIKGLLGNRQNPMNVAMAEHMSEQLARRLGELITYMEVE